MNKVQEAIFVGSHEESGIWDVLTDISDAMEVDRGAALVLLKGEIDFILNNEEIYLVRSISLYDSDFSEVIEKIHLLGLALNDVDFNEKGPFYYLSNVPGI